MPGSTNYVTHRYSSVEFSVPDGQTNYDVNAQQSTFDDEFGPTSPEFFANKLVLRTDRTITLRLNTDSNDAITIASTDSPFTLIGTEIHNLFITNASGNAAAIKLLLQKV